MLLQKTSWRIKQLISHRKDTNHGNLDNDVDDDSAEDTRLSTNNLKRHSWLSHSPSEVATPLRRASSNATSRSLHLAVPENVTAHSSASSLCSCDCEPYPKSKGSPLSKPLTSKSQQDILYPSALQPTTSGDIKRWQPVFSESLAKIPASNIQNLHSNLSTVSTITAGSMLDLKEALGEIDPIDDDKTPTQSIQFRDEPEVPVVFDNVEQLIRETDEAFQAVGSALAEAKAISHEWYDDDDAPIVRNFAVSRGISRKPSHTPVPSTKASIGRTISVTKTKAKKTKFIKRKANLFSRTSQTVPPPPANTPSRWTLMDVTTNMADVFSGKMFKMEVDEMLTPGRIQKLREEKSENERPSSKDSERSVETDNSTPTEPFHLESLSNRINAALGRDPSLIDSPPSEETLPSLHFSKKRSFQLRNLNSTTPFLSPPSIAGIRSRVEPAMTINDLIFPSPPRTLHRPTTNSITFSHRNTNANTLVLPTIPEISPLRLRLLSSSSSPSNTHPFSCPQSQTFLQNQTQDQNQQQERSYILLPSTPFSALYPLFLHGSIRVERRLPANNRKGSSPDGEPLDWTAFQIAVLGTVGIGVEDNLFDTEADPEWESEIDKLVAWFNDFGFLGYGELIDREVAEIHPTTPRTENSPLLSERNPIQAPPPRKISTASTCTSSLPPSPMLDFSIPGEEGEDVIPMGYNLGHDLGDFLDWEVRHVGFAGSFVDD